MNPCRCGEGFACTCFSIPDEYDFFAEFDGTDVDTEALRLSLQCGSSCGANCNSCSTKCCGSSKKKDENAKTGTRDRHSLERSKPSSQATSPKLVTNESGIFNASQSSDGEVKDASTSEHKSLKRTAAVANLDEPEPIDNNKLIQMVYNSVSSSVSCCQPSENKGDTGKAGENTSQGCCSKGNSENHEPTPKSNSTGSCCGGGAAGNCACCFDPENPTFYLDTDGVRTCGCGCKKPASDCSHCLKDLCEGKSPSENQCYMNH
ncbi:hypothetical protein K493DRAFT_56460 [Basidiobolus meristosporus CBS 931.73]|uniref:Uncharacterized protein n=1 Tax=Basidiobolus meristosporus CBS 931.73 TaxID=1314790 RepID=A0A1Y1XYC9_9FUNG|nr:hypothetical protein K493DRAFT_56460 [Basidiobolus meristosporus CBS 931.73]|eukprot:ORX90767.1 hypothetical protein K493DRAFT_56460 [Basidiobolus meristosporus CBS 931.73]